MGDGFAKIYGDKLLRSTLFLEPPEARLVFLAMLAMADADGVVDVPGVRALANALNLDVDYIRRALAILEAPDPDSRSKAEEGRRVLQLETGWVLVNYRKYREHRTQKQEDTRVRVAKHRAKSSVTGNDVRPEAEAAADGEAKKTPLPPTGVMGTDMSLRDIARIFRDVTGRPMPTDIDPEWTYDEKGALGRMRTFCAGDESKLRRQLKAMAGVDFVAKQAIKYWGNHIDADHGATTGGKTFAERLAEDKANPCEH